MISIVEAAILAVFLIGIGITIIVESNNILLLFPWLSDGNIGSGLTKIDFFGGIVVSLGFIFLYPIVESVIG